MTKGSVGEGEKSTGQKSRAKNENLSDGAEREEEK